MRWAWAEIDTDAIRSNVAHLCTLAPDAQVWVVVKADGYGHGATAAARAALAGGAAGLGVALVQEGVELRRAGVVAPILVLSEQPPEEIPAAVDAGLHLSIYSTAALDAIAAAGGRQHPVHLKVDTGMQRVGAHPDHALELARAIVTHPATRLAGVFTHLARADEPDDAFTGEQLATFDAVLARLDAHGLRAPLVHAANSAAVMTRPGAHRTLVRAGITAYGIPPAPALVDAELTPALSLRARVSMVKRVAAGTGISYGQRHHFASPTTVATLPVGYADGVPRRLFECGGEVLVGGRRRPIVGVVTMDQLMVDCGDDDVHVGDEAVLIGRQGDETITATEWAERLGTIAYEIVCGISARIVRRSM